MLERSIARISFERKESDLFSLWQSGDLSASRDPFLRAFLQFLKSDAFRRYIERIANTTLDRNAVDCAATRYDPGDHLLCHDDRLDTRRVAYILYLAPRVPRDAGGELCLYASDSAMRPTHIVKRYPPVRNTLALFLVSSTSHHAVSENVGVVPRNAVSGWFHG